ncbi:hypothetical protein SUDANB51_00603 [Streptomyces sp. enrichment culture]
MYIQDRPSGSRTPEAATDHLALEHLRRTSGRLRVRLLVLNLAATVRHPSRWSSRSPNCWEWSDTATTLGPYLVTADELEEHRDADGFLRLALTAEINGEVVGEDLLSNMSWTFEEMVAYASRGTWVRPGDVLGSGTCGNGGCLAELWGVRGRQDPPPLKPGDTVTLTVEGIGAVSNTVVTGPAPVPVPVARRRPRERP